MRASACDLAVLATSSSCRPLIHNEIQYIASSIRECSYVHMYEIEDYRSPASYLELFGLFLAIRKILGYICPFSAGAQA
jgi:hypothetical protein